MGVIIAGLVLTPASGASAPVVEDLKRVSGPSPFPASCTPSVQPLPADAPGEPRIAVDPHDPRAIVLVYGQLPSVVAQSSRDGGKSWTRTLPPGLSRCTGGSTDFTGDPVVATGPGGTVYLSSIPAALPLPNTTLFPRTWIAVNRSLDHGASWSAPVMVAPDDGSFWDKDWITPDPFRPGVAYEAFIKRTQPDGSSGFLAVSQDAGATFTEPLQNFPDQQLSYIHSPQIVVLPAGTLVEVFVQFNESNVLPAAAQVPVQMMSMRSMDAGAHWSAPIAIGEAPNAAPVDPDTGQQIDVTEFPSSATAPDGTIYVAWWVPIAAPKSAEIVFSKSTDGGQSWSAPAAVSRVGAQAWEPTIAVNSDNTVGVTWYDTRNDRPGDGQFTTDVWFADSHDAGKTWQQTHLAGPFDFLTAGQRDGRPFLGDYQGLAPIPHGFVAGFAQAQPQSGPDHSAVFFARIRLGQGATTGPKTCGTVTRRRGRLAASILARFTARGVQRAPRHGRVYVRICAPRRLRRLALTLRDRRHQLVGRGRARSVLGRRTISIRLIRRFAPGSFRLTITGRNPDGRRATLTARLPLKAARRASAS